MQPRADLVVVGAGMAGLCCARILGNAGLDVRLVEARDRVGGRVLTHRAPDAEAVELGAEFVHQDPEPTRRLAREAGVRLVEFADLHFEKQAGELVPWTEPFGPMTRVLERLKEDEPDTTASAFLERHDFDSETRRRFRLLVEGFEAVALDEVSIKSLATDADASEQSSLQRTVEGGYAALVDYLLARGREHRVRLELESPVTHIEHGAEGPRIHTARGELLARAAVLTLPVGVLEQQGVERFGLGARAAQRIERLGMGQAARVSFVFDADFCPRALPVDEGFVHQTAASFGTFWRRRAGERWIWTAWAGGPRARELARISRAEQELVALDALAALLGTNAAAVQNRLLSTHAHDFSNDPWSQGAYSFVRPGGSTSPEPDVDEAPLFLAGEAFDGKYPGTVAGALASGEHAAEKVLTYLRAR